MTTETDVAECQACLCLASRRAARAITRLYERHLRPHGIRATQFTALVVLRLGGPMTIGEIASKIGVERTTLSRNLTRLEAQGWVTVASGDEDARSRIIEITDRGRAMLGTALPAWRAAQRAAVAAVGGDGAEAFRNLAGKQIA